MRDGQALELRCAGHTYDRIASVLGFGHRKSAQRAVERALARDHAEHADMREEMRTIMRVRIERLFTALWTRAVQGDQFAVDRVVRLMERQARLFGLDDPVKVEVSSDARERVVGLIDQLRRLGEESPAEEQLPMDDVQRAAEVAELDETIGPIVL